MNPNETIVAEHLAKKGNRVIKRGWPDFLCVKQQFNRITKEYTGQFGGALAVEVKAGRDKLSEDQRIVRTVLKLAGIATYVIRSDDVSKGLVSGRLKIWSTKEIHSLSFRLRALEDQPAEREREIRDLRALLNDCAVLFEETNNYPLDGDEGPRVDHLRRSILNRGLSWMIAGCPSRSPNPPKRRPWRRESPPRMARGGSRIGFQL